MKNSDYKLNETYKSTINDIANNNGITYEIIKKYKTRCWVRMHEKGKPTDKIYKGIEYRYLKEK